MKLNNNFWWSTITLVVGTLLLIAGMAHISPENDTTNTVIGFVMIAGAVAYISLKRRRLAMKGRTLLNLIVETICLGINGAVLVGGISMVLSFGFVRWDAIEFLGHAAYYSLIYEQVAFLFVPLWCLGAYAWIAFQELTFKNQKNLY